MIIKLYTRGAVNNLHIIENVKRIKVHGGDSNYLPLFVDDLVSPFDLEHLNHAGEPCKAIQFEREDGSIETLVVLNKAYICNDDGKTIETVKVDLPPSNNVSKSVESK